MRFGIAKLSNIALRSAPDTESAIVTMAHYGEGFKIFWQCRTTLLI